MNTYTVDQLVAVLREDILYADNTRLCADYVLAMREAASELLRQSQEIQALKEQLQATRIALAASSKEPAQAPKMDA